MPPGLESIAEALGPCCGSSAAPSCSSSCQELTFLAEADLPSPARRAASVAGAGGSSQHEGVMADSNAAQSNARRPPVGYDAAATRGSHAWSTTQQLQHAFLPKWSSQLQLQQQEAGELCERACQEATTTLALEPGEDRA